MERETLARKTQADAVLERAAIQLQQLLKEACAELDPFPPFPPSPVPRHFSGETNDQIATAPFSARQ
jgi:hypothetical protein